MKRLSLLTAAGLLASTPLFAMDGGGVSISGEANFGVKFAESDDDSKSELQFHHEFKVTFAASGTTDGGIGFGGEMTLDNTESVTVGKTAASKGKRDWIGDSLNADIISRQDDGALGVFTTGASGGFSTTFGTGNTTITKDNLNDALGLNKYEVDKAVPGEIVFVREGQLVRIKPDDVEKSGWTLVNEEGSALTYATIELDRDVDSTNVVVGGWVSAEQAETLEELSVTKAR